MKILFIGDIVSKPGKDTVIQLLPQLKIDQSIDLVIANAENVTQGRGASADDVSDLVNAGVDFFTSGDHIFWQKNTDNYIESLPVVIPANYPAKIPGKRFGIVKDTLIINVKKETLSSISKKLYSNFSPVFLAISIIPNPLPPLRDLIPLFNIDL